MDYSKMSDQEINLAVANIFHPELSPIESKVRPPSIFYPGVSEWYDYCNNPADAWPIIVENKISLNWAEVEKSWCAHVGGVMTDGCWCWDYDPDHHQDNINPLRAAMIVFLMMQDSANVPANPTGSDIR